MRTQQNSFINEQYIFTNVYKDFRQNPSYRRSTNPFIRNSSTASAESDAQFNSIQFKHLSRCSVNFISVCRKRRSVQCKSHRTTTNQFNVGSDVSYRTIQRRQWRFIQIIHSSTSTATIKSIRTAGGFRNQTKMVLSKLTDSQGSCQIHM